MPQNDRVVEKNLEEDITTVAGAIPHTQTDGLMGVKAITKYKEKKSLRRLRLAGNPTFDK